MKKIKSTNKNKIIKLFGLPIYSHKKDKVSSTKIFGILVYKYTYFKNFKIMNILGLKVKVNKKNYDLKHQKMTAQYLQKKYVKPYLNNKIPKNPIIAKQNLGTDKIIWQYWGQGINQNTPPLVKICLSSVNKYKGDYKQIILTDENINEYIDIPQFIYDKLQHNDEFTHTFFSDILRIYLLCAYGGIWIDATILLTDKINDDILTKDFFLFQRAEKHDYNLFTNYNSTYFSWDKKHRVNMLSSFILAKKNHIILETLKNILSEYWKNEKHFMHYFVFQIMFDELMKIKKYKIQNCKKVSDLLPHYMQVNMNNKYTDELWTSITNKCTIHKLTYKYKNVQKDSILEHILQGSICDTKHYQKEIL